MFSHNCNDPDLEGGGRSETNVPTNRSRAEKTKENDELGVQDVSGRSSQLASKLEVLFPSK